MSDAGTGGTPAGWYEDGVTAGQERYWDGAQWTDQFRPIGGAAPEAPAAPEPVAAAPVEPEPVVAAPAAAPDAVPPTTEYPAYVPATSATRAPGKGLSRGALIGIIVAAVVVVAAIIVLIIGASTDWFRGGGGAPGAGSPQATAFLLVVHENAEMIGVTYTDAEVLDIGQKMCAAAAKINPADPMGSLGVLGDLAPLLADPVLFGLAGSGLHELCPDVYDRLEGMGG